MTPVPVKILIVDRLGDQFLLTVRAESEKYKGKVDRLSSGAIHTIRVARTGNGMKTHTGVSRSVRLGTPVLLFVSSVSETLVEFAIFLLEPHEKCETAEDLDAGLIARITHVLQYGHGQMHRRFNSIQNLRYRVEKSIGASD